MKRLWLLFSQTATVLLAAYFVVMTMKPDWLNAGSKLPSLALVEARLRRLGRYLPTVFGCRPKRPRPPW